MEKGPIVPLIPQSRFKSKTKNSYTRKLHIIYRFLPYTGTYFMFFHYLSPDIAIYSSSQSSDNVISGEESAGFWLRQLLLYLPKLSIM